MQGQLRIDSVFVFIVLDEDGTEGVPAFLAPNGMLLPMVAADQARLDQLLPIARDMAALRQVPIHLCRFSTRELLETIGGEYVARIPGNEVRS